MRHLLPATLALWAALPVAHAADIDATLRPLYFRWSEEISGHAPIRERGALVAAALSHEHALSEMLHVAGTVELWGGRVDYDGYTTEGWLPFKTDTGYAGTREELALRLTLPLSQHASLRPFAAVGHRYWQRSRSDESWNTFFGRVGARAQVRMGTATAYAEAGALLPVRTRVRVDWSAAGYGEFELAPRNRASGFGAVGVEFGRASVSVAYEAMRFGRSPPHTVARSGGVSGAVIENSQAYQPESTSSMLGLALQYRF
jgi:hypothetical protein